MTRRDVASTGWAWRFIASAVALVLPLVSLAAPKFCVTPYLQRPATDAMTLIYFTDSACTSTAEARPRTVAASATAEGGAAVAGAATVRRETTGVWASALTNNVYQLNAGQEKNKWNNSLYRHRVRFEGLKPNCLYDYTVTLGAVAEAATVRTVAASATDFGTVYTNSFRTAPDRNTPIRFVSYADCETTSSRFGNYTKNLQRMQGRTPDLITSAGDLTARGGIQSHWDEFWMQNAGGNGIGATDILGSIPMLTAIGNHDLFDNAAHSTSGWYHDAQGEVATEKFLSYFEFNSNGVNYAVRDGTDIPETRDMSQLFHREDYGPVTLIFLDSNNGKDCRSQSEDEASASSAIHDQDSNYCKYNNGNHQPGGMNRWKGARHPDFNPGSPQYTWLTNNLADAQRKSRFTFVFNHHCPYSVGGHNQSWSSGEDASALPLRVLTETMVRYGVDGWYCGHDELLEHSITNGYEILPNGQRRKHTLSIYDLGCSGDSARSSSGASNPLKYWQGSGNYGGTGSYGFLETDVTTNKNGQWTCTITPVQGSSGNYLNAQVVYLENPDRGENENDLVYAQATGSGSLKIDGASQTKPSDWLAFTRDSSSEEGGSDDPGDPGDEGEQYKSSYTIRVGEKTGVIWCEYSGKDRWWKLDGGDDSVAAPVFVNANPDEPKMSGEHSTRAKFTFTGLKAGTTTWKLYSYTDGGQQAAGTYPGYDTAYKGADGKTYGSNAWSDGSGISISVTVEKASSGPTAKFVVTPYVQHPATNAMTILFFADAAAEATVRVWQDRTVAASATARDESAPVAEAATVRDAATVRSKAVTCVEATAIKNASSRYRGRVRFEGLDPLTDYRYEVTLAGGETYGNTFRTLPGKNTPVRFIGYCDSETTPGTGKTTEWDYVKNGTTTRGSYYVSRSEGFASNLVHMVSRRPDLITVSGDLVAKGCGQDNWDEYWKENAGGLGLGYGDPAGSIPILAAIGNHDLKDGDTLDSKKGGAAQYEKFFTYFEFNTNGVHYDYADQTDTKETRDTSMLFHRTDLGPVTLIFLDTNKGDNDDYRESTQYYSQRPEMRSPDFHPGSLQYTWLTNNLADAQRNSKFTFVINHHCPYSVGIHNRRPGKNGYENDYTTNNHPDGECAQAVRCLTETMIRYGVDGWLCGHDEIIEHSQLTGTEIRPDGKSRAHTLNVYDLGSGGDGLRGNVVTNNPYEVFRAFKDAPCEWSGDKLVSGGSHYGFMEVDVTTNRNGKWTCSLTPCYDFINQIGGKAATFELRRYRDRIIIDEETDELVYQERLGDAFPSDYVEYVRPAVDAGPEPDQPIEPPVEPTGNPTFSVTPYLQHPAPTEMTVLFFTSQSCGATVTCDGRTFAADCEQATELVKVASDDKQIWGTQYRHRVRLTGLQPKTTYSYEVALEGGETYSNAFTTTPADIDTPVKFVAYSDSETIPPDFPDTTSPRHTDDYGRTLQWDVLENGQNVEKAYYVSRSVGFASNLLHMASWQPDFYIVAGDIAARGGVQAFWDEYWKEMAGGLGHGYGDPAGTAPILAVMGNHDHYDNKNATYSLSSNTSSDEIGLKKYLTYFEFEPNGVNYQGTAEQDSKNRDRSQLFHRLDYGPVTILFLDTNKGGSSNSGSRVPEFKQGSLQYQWIEANLKDARDVRHSRFIFVVNHQCPYSCGKHNKPTDGQTAANVRTELTDLMLKYGVTGWLAGHDEMQEHAQVTGTEVLADGSTRTHTMNVYDLGSGGDGLRGEREYLDNEKYIVFSAYHDSPDGTHYGHLQVEVAPSNGVWYCTMTPAYSYFRDETSPSELRYYKDKIIIKEGGEHVYEQRLVAEPEADATIATLAANGSPTTVTSEGKASLWNVTVSDDAYLTASVTRNASGTATVSVSGLKPCEDELEVCLYADSDVPGEGRLIKTIRVLRIAEKDTDETITLQQGSSVTVTTILADTNEKFNCKSDNTGYVTATGQQNANGSYTVTINCLYSYDSPVAVKIYTGSTTAGSGTLLKTVTVNAVPAEEVLTLRVGETATRSVSYSSRRYWTLGGEGENAAFVRLNVSANGSPTAYSDKAGYSLRTSSQLSSLSVSVTGRAVGEETVTVARQYNTGDPKPEMLLRVTVVPYPVTVTPATTVKNYGAADPEIAYSISPSKLPDGTEVALDGALSRVAGETIGSYDITLGDLAEKNPNYELTLADSATGGFRIKGVPVAEAELTAAISYWQRLSSARVVGTMKDQSGTEVKGTFVFSDADRMPSVAESGLYEATFVPDLSDAYDPVKVSVRVTVSPLSITEAVAPSQTYDATVKSPVVTVKAGGLAVDADSFEVTDWSEEPKNAGDYTATVVGRGNFTGSVTLNFTINPAAATVTPNAAAKEVGAKDPELTATVIGVYGDETVAYVLSRESGEEIGRYEITASGADRQGNYTVSFETGVFRVTRANPLTDGDLTSVITYGTKLSAATVVGRMRNREGVEVPGVFAFLDSDLIPKVGESGVYMALFTPKDGTTYEAVEVPVTVTVGKKELKVRPSDLEITYGDPVPTYAFALTGFIAGEDAVKAGVTGAPTFVCSYREGDDAADYKVTLDTVGTLKADNYSFAPEEASATLTVAPLAVTVTPKPGQVAAYGAAIPEIAWTSSPAQLIGTDTWTGALAIEGGTGVGAHRIVRGTLAIDDGCGGKNYDLTVVETVDFVIGKIAIDLSGLAFESKTVTYSGAAQTIEVADELPEGVTVAYSGGGRVDAGTYTVTATFAVTDANVYEIGGSATKTATLTINKATITSATAADAEYTGSTLTPVVTVMADGLVVPKSDSSGYKLGSWKKSGSYSYGSATLRDIATYTTTVTGTGNFTGTANLEFKIVKAHYDMSGVAFTNETVVYDGKAHSLAISGTLPSVSSSAKVSNPVYSGNGKTDVGTYTVTVSFTSGDSTHYEAVGPMTATLTIVPATITEATAANQTYSGAALTPVVTVKAGTLDVKTFDDEWPAGLTNVGTYRGAVTGTGNFTGTLPVDFTIDPKPVTVQADALSKEYGTDDPEPLTATVTGTVGADTVEYAVARTAGEAVGSYLTTPSGDELQGNYTVTYKTAYFKITKAIPKPTAEGLTASIVYGTKLSGATVVGTMKNRRGATVKGAFKFAEPDRVLAVAESGSPCAATFTAEDSATYDPSSVEVTVSVARKELTVSAADRTIIYGEEPPTYGYSLSGFVNGENASVVSGSCTYSCEYAKGSDVGTYDIGLVSVAGLAAANYSFTASATPGTLTVNPKPVTVTANNASKNYGMEDPAGFTATVTDSSGKALDPSLVAYALSRTAGANAGTYQIIVEGEADQSNYAVTFKNGTFTINKATIASATAASMPWTGSVLTPTVIVSSSDGLAFTSEAGFSVGNWRKSGSYYGSATLQAVGTYTATVSAKSGGNLTGSATVTFEIVRADYDMSGVTFADKTYTYDGKEKTLTVSGTLPGSLKATYSNNSRTDAGEQTATVTFSGADSNHNNPPAMTAKLKIEKAALTSATAANQVYDGTKKSPVVTVKAGSLDVKTFDDEWPSDMTNVGTYGGRVTGTGNFTGTVDVDFTVTRAKATVKADNRTKAYGEKDPTFTATVSGTFNGDGLEYAVGCAHAEDVGTYEIKPTGAAEQGNYQVTYQAGSFTITKAAPKAADTLTSTIEYGKKLSEAVVQGTMGDLVGKPVAGTYSFVTPGQVLAVGTHSCAATFLPDDADNFASVDVTVQVTVVKKTLTVRAADTSVTYGTEKPSYQYVLSGFASGESAANVTITGEPAYSSSYVRGTDVGEYDFSVVNVGTLASDNYSFAVDSTAAKLKVTPKAVTVTSENAQKTYGKDDPVFTAKVEGALEGEEGLIAYGLARAEGEDVKSGGYLITPTGGTEQGNYTVTFVAKGILTIDPATITSATAASQEYTGSTLTPVVTVMADGLVVPKSDSSGYKLGSWKKSGSYSYGSATLRDIATYTTTVTGVGNFTGSAEVDFTVTKAHYDMSKVIFADETVVYDGKAHSLAISGTLPSVTSSAKVSNPRYDGNGKTDVGTYTVTVSFTSGDSTHYEAVQPMTATLTIVPATLTEASAAGSTYDGKKKTPSVTAKAGTLTATTEPVGAWDGNLTDAGTYHAKVRGTGNFDGEMDVSYTISPATLTQATAANQVYDGTAKKPALRVLAGTVEAASKDYDLSVWSGDLVGAGTYTATVTGKGNFTGQQTVSFTVEKATYAMGAVTFVPAETTYDGKPHSILISGTLPQGVSVSYVGNGQIDAGTYVITAKFAGDERNYEPIVDRTATLTINPATLTEATAAAATYSGLVQSPKIVVKAGDLVVDADSCSIGKWSASPKEAGTYTAMVTGSGNFTGTKDVAFTINKAPLVVAADDKGVGKDQDPPPFTATYSGFVNHEDTSVLEGELAFDCPYDKTTAEVGDTFDITPSGLTAKNYAIAFEKGTLEVGKSTPTVESLTASAITYGQTLAASKLVGAAKSEATGVSGTFAWVDASVRPTVADSGKAYDVTFTPDDLANYTIAHFKTTVEVRPVELTVTVASEAVTYGDAAPKYTCEITGFIEGEDESVVSGSQKLTCAYKPFGAAGTYPISSDLSTFDADNYTFKAVDGTLTVGKALLTVSAKDLAVAYWEEPPAYAVTFAGFLGGDTAAVVSGAAKFTCAYERGSNVGSYGITVSDVSGLKSSNYTFVASAEPGTLTVNRKAVTVSADNQSKPYGANDPELTATVTGTVGGQSVAFGLTVDYKGADPLEAAVGTYTIQASGAAEQGNYAVSYKSGTMTVSQATLKGENLEATIVYGQRLGEAKVTGEVKSASRGWSMSAAIEGTFSFKEPERLLAVSESGPYTVTFTPKNTWAYRPADLVVQVTVEPKTLTVRAEDEEIVYGDEPPAEHARTIDGFIDGEDESVISGTCTYSCAYERYGSVGSYPISVGLGGLAADNYVFVAADPAGQLTVTAKAATITAKDAAKTYGQDDPAFEVVVEGTVHGDSLTNGFVREAGEHVREGGYAITPTGDAVQGNYAVTYIPATLTIEPAEIDFADAEDAIYDGTAQEPKVEVLAGELSATYRTGDWDGDRVNAGTYWGYVYGTGDFTGKMKIRFIVKPAKYDLFGVSFDSGSVTYDGEPHSLVIGGTLPDGVTVAYEGGDQTEAGSYTVTAKFAGDANHEAIPNRTAVLTVNPAPIARVEVEPETYDGTAKAPKVHAFTASGLEATTLEIGTWSGQPVAAGTYTAKVTGTGNFTSTREATFVIQRAAATVIAQDAEKEYRAEDPDLTARVEGLFKSDTVNYSLSRELGEEPGTYEINVTYEEIQGNYTVSAEEGTFTIVAAKPQVAEAFAGTLTYGEALGEAILSGRMVGHESEEIDGRVTFADPEMMPAVAESGDYEATFTPTDTKHYESVALRVAVKVAPRELKVRAKDETVTYGDEPPESYDYLCTGFVNGEDQTVVTGVCAYACDYQSGKPVGLYPIAVTDVSGLGSSNYCFVVDDTTNGWLQVIRKAVTVTADDKSKVYGADDPPLTVTITGRVDESDEIDCRISRETGSNVGEYAITPAGEAVQGNYDVAYRPGRFTIEPAPLTEATAAPQVYDGTVKTPVLTVKAGGHSATYEFAEDWSGELRAAGAYTAKIAGTGNFCGTQEVSFVIQKAKYDLSNVTFSDDTVTYDAKPHTLAVSGQLPDGVEVSYEGGEKTDAGTYSMTAVFTGDTANYEPISPMTARLVIEPRAITSMSAADATYDGEVRKPVLTVMAGDLTLADGDYTVGAWSDVLKNVGTYRAQITGRGNFCGSDDVYFSIGKAKVTVTANAASKEYGVEDDPDLTATVTGTFNGDTVAYDIAREDGEEVGTYAITPSGEKDQGNYEVSYKTGTFTVSPATPQAGELSARITYGETLADAATNVVGVLTGHKGEEIAGAFAFAEPARMPSVAESGACPATFTPADESRYKAVEVEVEVEVAKKELTVQALDAETTYGEAAPDFAYELLGFIEGEDSDVVEISGEPTLTCEDYAPGRAVGTYDIVVADTGDLESANYSFAPSASNATLTVVRRTATATAVAAEKTYGDGDPDFAVTIAGLYGEDSVTNALVREAGENVGSYALTPTGDLVQGNYDVTYVPGVLTIRPRALTAATAASQVYDGKEKKPALTVMADGFAVTSYDVGAWSGTLVNAGTYTATVSGRNNFCGEVVVEFTIEKADYNLDGVTFEDDAVTYDGQEHALEIGGDLPSGVTVSYAGGGTDCGVYTVTATFTGDGNHKAIAGRTATLTINPRPLAGATAVPVTYDGTRHEPVISVSARGLDIAVTYSVGAWSGNLTDAGTYYATVTGTGNFSGTADVTFVIRRAEATVESGGSEPGEGVVPADGLSKFDVTAMYDGAAHPLDLAAISNAYSSVIRGTFAVSGAAMPTNAGDYRVAYTITSPNYETFTHEARIVIASRPVTLTSEDATFTYDGLAHSNAAVTVGGEGFVAGEGVATSGFATITDKGSVPNEFDYELVLNPGSVSSNYLVTCVTGTLTVTQMELYDDVGPETTEIGFFAGNVTYSGWTRGAAGEITGQLVVKAAKANKKTDVSKLTVTYTPVGGKKKTIKLDKNAMPVAGGNPEVYLPGIGTVRFAENSIVGVDCDVQMGKDLFKDKATKKAAAGMVPQGSWTFALPSDAGYAGFSVTVAKTGKAKVAGVMTDGTKVSVSVQGIFGDNGKFAIPVVYAKKAVSVAFVMWINTDTRESGISDSADKTWNSVRPSVAFTLADGQHVVSINGLDVEQEFTVAGKKWTFPKYSKKDPSSNPTSMKLTWTAKTGVVKGSFKIEKTKYTVNGVVVDGVVYGSAFNKGAGTHSVKTAEL